MELKSHYDVLQISRHASADVIRAAYKALAQKFHPDRNGNGAEAIRAMQEVNAAYKEISDPQKRAAYDALLRAEEERTKLSTQDKDFLNAAAKAVADAAGWDSIADKELKEAGAARARVDEAAAKALKMSAEKDKALWGAIAERAAEEEATARKNAAVAAAKADLARDDAILAQRKFETGSKDAALTHYDALKIAPCASEEVVAAAYAALSQKFAVLEGGKSLPEVAIALMRFHEAAATLSDPARKSAYDAGIRSAIGQRKTAHAPPASGAAAQASTALQREAREKAEKAAARAKASAEWVEKAAEDAADARKKADEAAAEAQRKSRGTDAEAWQSWAARLEAAAKDAQKSLDKAREAARSSAAAVDEAEKYLQALMEQR